MLHHVPRLAGLLAILASLTLAPGALAATPSKAPAGAKAKERAYGRYCGAKRKGPGAATRRTKCLDAMSKLATGRSSSPSKACRGLSRKKAKGERKSAYARCVSEGARLLKGKRRGKGGTSSATGDDYAEADDESADDAEGDDGGEDEEQPADDDAAADPGASDDDTPADPEDGEPAI